MDTIVVVFEFCSPRDLLTIASTSQELSRRVTYSHVLRSSLMRGGPFCKAFLETMFGLCRKGAIFVPSPMRLLRLLNTRRCEMQGCSTKTKSIETKLGLSLCSKCRSKSYTIFDNNETRNALESMEIVNKNRVASSKYGSFFSFFAMDYIQGGEREGPIITGQTMDRLCSTRGDTTLAVALENYFSSIPIGSKTFFENYDEILLESVVYHKSVEQKRVELLEKKMNINRDKFDVIKDSILNGLSDAPWSEHLPGSLYFDTVTAHLRKAPSKATKKGLQAIVNDILQKFDALFAFVKMDFLFGTSKIVAINRIIALPSLIVREMR